MKINSFVRSHPVPVLAVAVAILLPWQPAAAAACSPQGATLMKSLDGAWRGRGTVTPIGGVAERISCRVSYQAQRDGIAQNINCAGTDYRIEASARVSCEGNRISGSWLERIANNTGRVAGSIDSQRLRIDVDGPNFQGRIAVVFGDASRHTVTITQFDSAKGRHVPVASMALAR